MKKISDNDIIKDVETDNLDVPKMISSDHYRQDAKPEATLVTYSRRNYSFYCTKYQ